MTTPPKEPRAFLLSISYATEVNDKIHVVETKNQFGFPADQWFRVIEHSAYVQLQAELERVRAELARMTGTANGYAHGMFAAAQDLADAHDGKITRYRDMCERLAGALSERECQCSSSTGELRTKGPDRICFRCSALALYEQFKKEVGE
jgi:hypothetical protein